MRLSIVLFIGSFHVVVNDITVLVLTRLHHPQDGCKASVQGREVWLGQQGGHGCQRVLSQRLPHDVTQAETGRDKRRKRRKVERRILHRRMEKENTERN
ncbi:hypothetical protein INR49_028933 [Caranx melampygus]|nr:hypothetical protein INR49_028933 [Caranx melampygus]